MNQVSVLAQKAGAGTVRSSRQGGMANAFTWVPACVARVRVHVAVKFHQVRRCACVAHRRRDDMIDHRPPMVVHEASRTGHT